MTNTRLFGIILANLFAAFGAGGLMIKSLGLTSHSWLKGETILSFLVGPLLALALIAVSPKWLKTRGAFLFSFAAAATVALLAVILRSAEPKLAGTLEWFYFALLSFRFCFWGIARSLRMNAAAAGQQMSLSWTELSYYTGMIIGLIAWPMIDSNTPLFGSICDFGTNRLDIAAANSVLFAAMVVDVIFQIIAGVFDARWTRSTNSPPAAQPAGAPAASPAPKTRSINRYRVAGLALAVISVTAATEAVCFMLVEREKGAGRESVAGALWAASYIGPAFAAIICGWFTMSLEWAARRRVATSPGMIAKARNGARTRVPYSLVVGATIITLAIATPLLDSGFPWMAVVIVAVSFFAYETVSLTVLDRIGKEVPEESGTTAFIVNCMYVAAAFVTWSMVQVGEYVLTPLVVLAVGFALVVVGLALGASPRDRDPSSTAPDEGSVLAS